jgi:hypothetical protein
LQTLSVDILKSEQIIFKIEPKDCLSTAGFLIERAIKLVQAAQVTVVVIPSRIAFNSFETIQKIVILLKKKAQNLNLDYFVFTQKSRSIEI